MANTVRLWDGETLVKEYDEFQGQFMKIVGDTEINNRGSLNIFASIGFDEDPRPIYTLTHDCTVYVSDNTFLIKSAIDKECDGRCEAK